MQFRDKHRKDPNVVRWFGHHLSKHLLEGFDPARGVFRWSESWENGRRVVRRVWYRNTPELVAQTLHWMGRAGDHEAGNFEAGGRRAQGWLTTRYAGVMSHEASVLMAKSMKDSEDEAERARARRGT